MALLYGKVSLFLYLPSSTRVPTRGVVTQLGLDTVPLDSPLDANTLNGQLLARISERTVLVILRLSGNHQERIGLHIIDCPRSPLVLGHPWLKLYSPQIDWKGNHLEYVLSL